MDVRTLPGEGAAEVQAHLDEALGDLADQVEVEIIMNDPASLSRVETPLVGRAGGGGGAALPDGPADAPSSLSGSPTPGCIATWGAVAYGAGLFSPELDGADFGARFHGNDERIDIESLALTTQLWLDVVDSLWG